MRRSVSAVSMARSEYCRCPPRLPTPAASHVAIASGTNHTVTSPRWTSLGRTPASLRRGISSCTSDALSTSCGDRAPSAVTMARDVDGCSPSAQDPCTNARQTSAEYWDTTGLEEVYEAEKGVVTGVGRDPRPAINSDRVAV